ncbi:zinc finger protein 808-like [Lutzomyia longipalpis]|uniref:zinc finger protein 808-like n=1 Tax=Lutzomyia longipalpis TaxID=7200 RepID=UPI0024836421|nr:zinc finger protein 808-like [Lutzomyia longipalpis]
MQNNTDKTIIKVMEGSKEDLKDLDLTIVKEEYEVHKAAAVGLNLSKAKHSLLNQIKHKCSVCGVQFLNISQLSIHQKTHFSLGALGDFNCSECLRTFRFQQSLDEHKLRVHSNNAPLPYKASAASAGASRSVQQKSEQPVVVTKATTTKQQATTKTSGGVYQAEVATKVFECDKCEKKFKSKSGIKWHIRLIHEGMKPTFGKQKSFHCSQCSASFVLKEGLLNHMDMHNRESFECPKCPGKYTDKKDFFKHFHLVHRTDFSCNLCEKIFKNFAGYWTHIEAHRIMVQQKCELDEEALTCKSCRRTFRSIEKLKMHSQRRRTMQCDLCQQTIYACDRLKHIRHFHRIPWQKKAKNAVKIHCNHCGGDFSEKLRYENHPCFRDHVEDVLRKKHLRWIKNNAEVEILEGASSMGITDLNVEKPIPPKMLFECEICGRKFRTKEAIRSHINKAHVQVDPYKALSIDKDGLFQCDMCLKKVPFGSLREHMRQEGRNVFPCKLCGGLFSRLFDLKRHKALKLTNTETFQCPQCPRTFHFKGNLNIHAAYSHGMRVECRDYICKVCGKKFDRSANFSNHTKRHKMEILECKECKRVFRGHVALKRHIGVVHFGMHRSDFTGQKHPCEQCPKVFSNQFGLEKHQLCHMADRPFKCKICLKTYKHSQYLAKHIKDAHTDITSIAAMAENGEATAEFAFKMEDNAEGNEDRKPQIPEGNILENLKNQGGEPTKIIKMETHEAIDVKVEWE